MSDERIDPREQLLGINVGRRTVLGGILGLSAGALLAACGGGGGDDDDTSSEDTSSGDTGGTTQEPADSGGAEATESSPEDVVQMGTSAPSDGSTRNTETLTVWGNEIEITDFEDPEPGEPSGSKPNELIIAWGAYQFTTYGIDPQRHVGTVAEGQLRHMYEPLVAFDRDFQIVPALATEWERIDDLTVQFKLREGVTFHNGEPFNAEAVRYSVFRPLQEETAGAARATYSIIEEVEIVDDLTVNIKTSNPDPVLVARMSGFHMTMVAPEWAKQGPDVVAKEAVGTGPYKFVSWSPNEDLVMGANEDYWDGAPSIKNVRLTTINEQSTRVAAVRSGDVHVAKDMPPEELDSINSGGQARIGRAVSNRVPFYFITVDVEPYNDPLVRQAINYASNVSGVIEAILLGHGERVSGPLGKWVYGYDTTLEPYPDDPEKAQELLAEAGYPDGIDIDMWFRQGRYPKDREVAEAMAAEMGRAGIRCTPHLQEAAVLDQMMQAKETPGLNFASWGNWIFDADNSYVPLFGCETAENRDFDWTRPYGCNEEFEEIIQAARTELDDETRKELYAEAQRYLYDDGGALFMYQLVDIFGINNWVLWEPRHDEMIWAHQMQWNE